MADFEVIGLLSEHGRLHGVKLVRERGVTAMPISQSWPVVAASGQEDDEAAQAETAGTAAQPPETPAPDSPGLTIALQAAKASLKIDEACTLALPTSAAIVKVLTLPLTETEHIGSIVRLQLEKVAPCEGDELAVGYEILAQEEESIRVIAAAAPQESLDNLAEELRAAGLKLTRIDISLLSWWRQLVASEEKLLPDGTAMVLFEQAGHWNWVLARDHEIIQVRGLGHIDQPADLAQEITLSLLNHEMEAGPVSIEHILLVSPDEPAPDWITALAAALPDSASPVWIARERLGVAALGTALRGTEPGHLDLVPDIWCRQERERLQSRRLLLGFLGAVALWVVLAAVLYSLPQIIQNKNNSISKRIKAEEPSYRAVSDVRQRVRLIRSYMDRSQSLLEIMRELTTTMPQGLSFSSITYRRGDAVKVAGDASYSSLVYDLKDAMDATGRYDSTRLTGPTLDGARSRYRYEIDARLKEEAE